MSCAVALYGSDPAMLCDTATSMPTCTTSPAVVEGPPSSVAEAMFLGIVKLQNKWLLERIADHYGWNKEAFLRRYWTPTLYVPTFQEPSYPIRETIVPPRGVRR